MRDLVEMMAERGLSVVHTTDLNGWIVLQSLHAGLGRRLCDAQESMPVSKIETVVWTRMPDLHVKTAATGYRGKGPGRQRCKIA